MISFNAYGHENIKSTHKNTIEFTKEKEISPSGNCILGVNADYDLEKIKKFIAGRSRLKMKITVGNLSDELEFTPNPKFNDNKEMVMRLGEFASERTLGLRAGKAAKHINKKIVGKMKIPGKKMTVSIKDL